MQRTACLGAKFAVTIGVMIGVVLVCFASTARAEAITVFAAASLRDAVGEGAQAFEATTNSSVTLVFAASSTIARQVAQGAPADVVLLADTDWADWLVGQGTLDAMVPFAANRLVLLARDADAIDDPSLIVSALAGGHLAMAQVDAVPAGRYGKAALVSLGLWDTLQPKVVQANNVRAALRFVERGEAHFGIGYASDLVAFPSLTQIYGFDTDSHPPIVFSGGAITPNGEAFTGYLQSQQGQDLLTRWGFLREVDTE